MGLQLLPIQRRVWRLVGYVNVVSEGLGEQQVAAITMLLQNGKTVKEIVKFAEMDSGSVTRVARQLDLEPTTEVQRRGKELYASSSGLTFQQIAKQLASEGFTAEDDAPMHHLTVASWVKNYGWGWGGAADGEYAPEHTASKTARSKYVRRLSKSLDAEVNADDKIAAAAESAWHELSSDRTVLVQLAVIRGAAHAGVTDVGAVKKVLFETHGDEIRSATV